MTLTFLEWVETLPEAQKAVTLKACGELRSALVDFFRALATAKSITDVNVAAGVVLNFIEGVE